MEYRVIRAIGDDEAEAVEWLVKRINELLKDGAKLQGGISVAIDANDNYLVYQAVIVDE